MFKYEYWGRNKLSISDNMALEELMLSRSAKLNVATVRFWDVDKDAAVLGYGEAPSAIKKRDVSFDVARRITGGTHVEFDRSCLAYSFTVPRDGSFKHYEDMRKYYADKVAAALSELGVGISSVDNRASTINVDGRVAASHAMFWGVKAALMHGLMIIEPYDVDKILGRMVLGERRIGRHFYREYDALRNIPALGDLVRDSGRSLADERAKVEIAKKLISEMVLKEIAHGKHRTLAPAGSTIDQARALVASEHTGKPWVNDRAPPLTDRHVEEIPGEELAGKLKEGLGYCMYSQVADKDFKKMAEPED